MFALPGNVVFVSSSTQLSTSSETIIKIFKTPRKKVQSWPKIMGQSAIFLTNSFSVPPALDNAFMYSPKDSSCSELCKGEGVSAIDNESFNKVMATA